jgi:hypothetical protein
MERRQVPHSRDSKMLRNIARGKTEVPDVMVAFDEDTRKDWAGKNTWLTVIGRRSPRCDSVNHFSSLGLVDFHQQPVL